MYHLMDEHLRELFEMSIFTIPLANQTFGMQVLKMMDKFYMYI